MTSTALALVGQHLRIRCILMMKGGKKEKGVKQGEQEMIMTPQICLHTNFFALLFSLPLSLDM